jgi:hypothetical protein
MGEWVRHLRAPVEAGAFRYRRPKLNAREADAVRKVVNALRIEPELPGGADIPDLIAPVTHVFARPVPGFQMWVCYTATTSRLTLWAIKFEMVSSL